MLSDATLKQMALRRNGIAKRILPAFALAPISLASVFAIGCASPGPPRSPSLNLPQPVSDLAAGRTGNLVELSFTVPYLSTDKLPLFDPHHRKTTTLHGTICRELDPSLKPAPCTTIAAIAPQLTATDHASFTWHETLPEALATGTPRLLAYRVQFQNKEGKSAGESNAAYTATGAPPSPVANLRAEGTRSGILLQWKHDPATSDVLLHRIDLAPKTAATVARPKGPIEPKTRTGDLWLNANSNGAQTLDASVAAGTPYRYTALRRTTLTLDKHTVELRSDVSAAVDFTLHPVYAPAAPTGIEATGFTPPDNSHFAVDLIWQPLSDAGVTPALAAPLTGYNVYREQLDGSTAASKTRLTTTPSPQPSFHDSTAEPNARYRYSITAIDANGNESDPATFTLEPSPH